MQIIDNKAIVLRTRSPAKYSVIPRSKVLREVSPGLHEVAIYFGLDEARVLRNLGVKNAPSPITVRYDWPGRYKPFAHQIDTASFLTLNRRAFVFSEPGCVDADTEYLSPTGWKRIADYAGGEVAQYHPETGEATFVLPQEFVKLPCEDMVRIKTKYGLDQMLSPEHRTLVHSNAADKWCVMEAAEVLSAHDDWHAGVRRPNARKARSSTVGFAHMSIPTVFSITHGKGIALTDAQLRLQVAVIADGHFSSDTNRCVVRVKKPRKVARLHALLSAANTEYLVREQSTPTAQGFFVFTFNAPWRCKEFGQEFWACSAEQRSVIADEVVHWDGTIRGDNNGASFSTTSRASADFIQYVWASLGTTARITEDMRDRYRNGVCYTVQARGGANGGKHGLLAIKSKNNQTVSTAKSTDGFKYCFMVPSTFLLFRRNGCIFASGNTGKTLSALWAADYLIKMGEVRRVLILCPLSIMHSAWMRDIGNSIIHRTAAVAHHTIAGRRVEIIKKDYEFVVLNYDGLNILTDTINKDARFDLVIVDEASHLKNVNTQRWKALNRILKPTTMLWMLTGTPAAQSPLDAYGLAKLVNPGAVPKFFAGWRDKVMTKITNFKWAAKDTAPSDVYDALQPAIRYTKEECLDLPPVITTTREVELTAQQKKYYKLLKEHLLVQAAGETITAVNAAAGMSKLLQISAGAAYTDTHEVIEFDCSPRLSVLLEIVNDTDRKVIVFAPYRHSIETISKHLTNSGISNEQIDGDVPASKRTLIFKKFQETPDPRVLVIQPQAAAHGVTLTAADTVVFWGPVMSVETYVQCCARADRVGQDSKKVLVVHIQGSEIERKMFAKLQGRVAEHNLLVDLYKEEVDAKSKA